MLSQRSWGAILFLNLAFIISRAFFCGNERVKYSYIDKDYPMKLPVRLEQVQATFDCSVRYALDSPNAGEVWIKSTDTRNGGFVRLGPDRRAFAVSMFHELHCLSVVSRSLNETNRMKGADVHIGHCLNYLRMFAQCSADATEEPVVKVSTLKSQGCAPSFVRRCSNWSTLYDFLSKNYLAFHEHKVVNGTWDNDEG